MGLRLGALFCTWSCSKLLAISGNFMSIYEMHFLLGISYKDSSDAE